MKTLFLIICSLFLLSQCFSQTKEEALEAIRQEMLNEGYSPLDEELQKKAELAIKQHYADTKFYLLKSIDDLYEQNDDEEFRKFCGTDQEIVYSIRHTYFLHIDKIEEFIQFDKDLNILAIIPQDSMTKYMFTQVEQSLNIETIVHPDYNQVDSKGQKQGVWSEYIDDGNLRTETTYIDGVPNGTYKTYRKDGEKCIIKKR